MGDTISRGGTVSLEGAIPGKPVVLVVEGDFPRSDRDAGSILTMHYVRFFARLGYQVVFAAATPAPEHSGDRAALQAVGAITVQRGSDGDAILRLLEQSGAHISVALLSRVHAGGGYLEAVMSYCPDARIIFLAHDLHFLREQRAARLFDDPLVAAEATALQERETDIARMADTTIVVSNIEAELLTSLAAGARVRQCPLIQDPVSRSAGFQSRNGIAFIGGYQHKPNVDAVTHFLDDIWPAVRAAVPQAQFYAIGADMPTQLSQRTEDGFTAVGHVADLGSWLEQVRITVAPLRFGAGVKGKVLLSLAHGVPCVTTLVAAEGIDADDAGLVVSDPDSFAKSTIRLYQDRDDWLRRSNIGQAWVGANTSTERGLDCLIDLLSELDAPLVGAGPHVKAGVPSPTSESGPIPYLPVRVWRTQLAYQDWASSVADVLTARRARELVGSSDRAPLELPGYCVVCASERRFRTDGIHSTRRRSELVTRPNWREQLFCDGCGFNNRSRAAFHLLEQVVQPHTQDHIYVTEAVSPWFARLSRRYPFAIGSEYQGSKFSPGAVINGVRHEDLQELSFPDDAFDVILSFDVLEHIPFEERAFAELARCLRPGGRLLATAPCRLDMAEHEVRARVSAGGELNHLMEPEYHANPVDPEAGSLSYRSYGWQVLEQLKEAGFADAVILTYWSERLRYYGEPQYAILAIR